jgi:hypothetical protein
VLGGYLIEGHITIFDSEKKYKESKPTNLQKFKRIA